MFNVCKSSAWAAVRAKFKKHFLLIALLSLFPLAASAAPSTLSGANWYYGGTATVSLSWSVCTACYWDPEKAKLQEYVGGSWVDRTSLGTTQSYSGSRSSGTHQFRLVRYRYELVEYCPPGWEEWGCDYTEELDYITTEDAKSVVVTPPTPGLPSENQNGNADTSYNISWSAQTSATSYQLRRRQAAYGSGSYGSWSTVYNGSSTSAAQNSMADGHYQYQVRACSSYCGYYSSTRGLTVLAIPGTPNPSISSKSSNTDTTWTISWGAPSGRVTSYNLQRRHAPYGTSSYGSWSTIQSSSATSKSESNSTDGHYQYRARACNESGCGSWSSIDTATVLNLPGNVGTPTIGSKSGLTDTAFTVNWSAPSGRVTSYNLRRRTAAYGSSSYGSWSTIQSSSATSRSETQTSDGNYQYDVRACNESGCSSYSGDRLAQVLNLPATPATPTVSSKSGLTDTTFTVNWVKPSGRVTSYTYQRRTAAYGSSSYSGWSTITPSSTLYDNETQTSDGNYQYQVRACNEAGCTGYSGDLLVQVLNLPGTVSTPSVSGKSGLTDTTFTVSWSAPSGRVTSYNLQRRSAAYGSSSYGSWSTIQSSSATSKGETQGSDGNYQYQARACNEAGCASYSGDLLVQVLAVPGTPGALSTSSRTGNTDTNFNVNWGGSTGSAITYKVERRYQPYGGSYDSWTQVQASGATSYNHTLTPTGTYQYRVKATNTSGDSSYTSSLTEIMQVAANQVGSPQAPNTSLTSTSVVSTSEQQVMDQVGTIPGSFSVGQSGSANYSIPIEVLEGTAGVAPQLSLNYSSGRASSNGLLGIGWNIGGLSAITRCRITLQEDGDFDAVSWGADDVYCLDGQRLLLVSGTYGAANSTYRTSVDTFATVTALGGSTGDPAYFKVVRKDGSVSYYGNTADSSLDGSSGTLTWAINRFEDNVGNEIVYTYIDDTSGQRIDEISYAYGSGSTRNAYVEFVYEDRADDLNGYVADEDFFTKKRVDKIIVGGTSALREYRLFYDESGYGSNSNDELSRLTSIQDCAVNVSPNRCLPKTTFTWEMPDDNISSTVATKSLSSVQIADYEVADINGDGIQDIVYTDTNGYLRYSFVTINGSGAYVYTDATAIATGSTSPGLELLDYNSDGRDDVLVYCNTGSSCANSGSGHGYYVYLATPQSGGGWSLVATSIKASELVGIGVDDNGDGLQDVISKSGNGITYLVEDSGASAGSNTPYELGTTQDMHIYPHTDNNYDLKDVWGVGDFNGDGRIDIVGQMYQYYCSWAGLDENGDDIYECEDWWVRFAANSLGYDSGLSAIKYNADSFAFSGEGVNVGTIVSDINNDGLSDIIYPDGSEYYFRLSEGSDFTTATSVSVGVGSGLKVADINGDGYTDVYWVASSNIKFKLWQPSTESFGSTSNLNVGGSTFTTASGTDYELRDMNADGRVDLFSVKTTGTHQFAINKNGGFNLPGNVITEIEDGLGAVTDITYEPISQADSYSYVEGIAGSTSSAFYTAQMDPFSGLNDTLHPEASAQILNYMGPLNVVTSVSRSAPTEASTTATSSTSYGYEEARAQAAGRGFLGFKAMTVTNDQTGMETRTEYRQDWPYSGRPIKVTVSLDLDNANKTISETTNTWSVRTRSSGFSGTWATTLASSGSAALGPLAPFIEQSVTKTYDPYDNTSNVISTVVRDNSYDGYGNGTQNVVKDYIGNQATLVQTVTTDNTYNDTGTGLGTTYSQEFGRLTQSIVTTTRGASTIKSKSTFDYYNSGQGAPDDGAHTGSYTGHLGMLRSESVWASDDSNYADTPESSISSTYYYYDSFGNRVLSRTDASSATRYSDRSVYDSLGRYVSDTYGLFANGSGVATSYKTSQVISRDAYGVTTEVRSFVGTGASDYNTIKNFTTARGLPYFSFDGTGTWSANNTISGVGSLCPTGTEFHVRSRQAGGAEAYECFDILGRSTRKLARGFDGSWAKSDTYYDNAGRVAKVSEPYTSTAYYTVTQYDALGRVTSVDGSASGTGDTTTFAYAGLETLQTTGRGNTRREIHNVLGEVVSVYENKSTDVSTVDGVALTSNERSEAHYQYNVHGNLTLLTDASSNTTSMSYDDIGRKLSMDDMDKGTWTYAYNNFGDQICQEDANGQVIWNTYDFRGRLIERNDYEENRSGVCTSTTQTQPTTDDGTTLWEYDQATDGLGQLNDVATLSNASDTTADYAKSMTFDSLGRLSQTVTEIEGLSDDNWEKTTYDQYGRTFQVFDAARNSDSYTGSAANGTEYRYNSYGYLDQIVDAVRDEWDVPRSIYYDVQTMDARGNVTAAEYGELMDVTSSYEADTGYLAWLAGSDGTTTYQNYDLDWDEVGNLNYRRNMTGTTGGSGTAITNENETFVYDGMNRLKTNSVNGTTVTLAYNPIGNITSKSDFGGGYTYGTKPAACTSVTGAVTPGPHAVSVANSISYCYDANGNMIKDTNRTLSYTAYDMVASIDNGSYTTTFEYGPDRGRYMREDDDGTNSTTTYYVGGVEKIYNDDGTIEWKRNIAGIGQITQVVNGSGTIQSESTAWFLKDHLGSITHIVNTTSGGAVASVDEMAFDPWGKRRTPTDWKTALASLTSFYMTGGSSGSFTTTKGFTGHEMLDEVGIIHMNGRIFDASLARFTQADPFIQAPFLTASHNRYSYTWNNPLNATDPSGYICEDITQAWDWCSELPVDDTPTGLGQFNSMIANAGGDPNYAALVELGTPVPGQTDNANASTNQVGGDATGNNTTPRPPLLAAGISVGASGVSSGSPASTGGKFANGAQMGSANDGARRSSGSIRRAQRTYMKTNEYRYQLMDANIKILTILRDGSAIIVGGITVFMCSAATGGLCGTAAGAAVVQVSGGYAVLRGLDRIQTESSGESLTAVAVANVTPLDYDQAELALNVIDGINIVGVGGVERMGTHAASVMTSGRPAMQAVEKIQDYIYAGEAAIALSEN